MNIHEYQAKAVLKEFGVAVPRGIPAFTVDEAIKAANELGLSDMTGNASEWCFDKFDKNYYKSSPSANPVNSESGEGRVIRGGAWGADAKICTNNYRRGFEQNATGGSIGFRICKVGN